MNKILLFFVLSIACLQHPAFSQEYKALLQARLHVISNNAHEIKTAKIQPGSKVKLQAEIKNIGNRPNAPGNVFIRFVLSEPLEDLLESRLFQTETLALPIIFPGQVIVLEFTKEHQWPSLHDFIKQNWSMRHYQAVVTFSGEKQEKILGHLPIFFSAHYYEGISYQSPQEVPSRKL